MKKVTTTETRKLIDVPNGEFFRTINSLGKLGSQIYTKGDYCKLDKTFTCSKVNDMCGWDDFKSTQLVLVGFTY